MTPSAGRVLALDVGERRIGVAMSDPDRIIASGQPTIDAKPQPKALEQICRLIEREEVTQVVIGLPLTLRGEIGSQAQSVQTFGRTLEKLIAVPIHFHDERLTSVAADRSLESMGVRKTKRKDHVDQVAAVFILQNYLDSLQTFRPWSESEEDYDASTNDADD